MKKDKEEECVVCNEDEGLCEPISCDKLVESD